MRVWVKRDDMTGMGTSGNKLRKLEYIVAEARAQGCDTLITCGGLQSNHCRATALVGARLGMAVHLLLRGEPRAPFDGNLMIDMLAGAKVSCYPPARYHSELDSLMAAWQRHYAERGRRAWRIPTGGSGALGLWAYIDAVAELRDDCAAAGMRADHIVCADGSGGTHAGLALGSVLHGLGASVWGVNVCESAAWFERHIAALVADWQERHGAGALAELPATQVIDGYAGPAYAVADQAVWQTIARLARLEGLLLDPVYTGKAFHGMLEEIAAGRFTSAGPEPANVVFVHTGGMPGLLAQATDCAAQLPEWMRPASD